jgi:hypothetical protein
LLVVAISRSTADAEPVTIVTRLAGEHGGEASAPAELLSLQFTPEPGDSGHKPLKLQVSLPGHAEIDLPADVRWRVELEDDRFWTRALVVSTVEAGARPLDVFPAGIVEGRLLDVPGEPQRSDLSVGFAPAGQQFPIAPDTSRCRLGEASRFRCTVPLGQYDLRFKTPQRAPVYRWGHKVLASSSVGDVRVSRGGTIAGYVSSEDVPKELKDLRITVRPSSEPHPSDGRVMDLRTVHMGPRGFFYTSALSPGIYDLVVDVPERGVAAVAALQVRDGLEARLPRPLVLEPRVPVTVRVTPAQPPVGQSWEIELLRAGPEGVRPETRGSTSKEGAFVASNLVSGQYHVIVRDDRGSRWAAQPLSVSPVTREFLVEIPIINTEGTLRRGTERLEGVLWFGGQYGTPGIRFETDAQGEFRGMLPRAGDWDVEVVLPPGEDTLAATAVVAPDEETNVARADVTIPDTLLEGVVVDTGGATVAQAEVTFNRGPQRLGGVSTNPHGHFLLRGLTAGPLDVVASASDSRSTPLHVDVNEGPNAPLRLTVHRLSALKSRVVGPGGPVPGARVAVWPEGGGQVSLTVTDSEGYFTAMGHPPMQRLVVAVHSPGLALFLRTFPPGEVQTSPITLSSGTGVLEIAAKAPISFVEHGTTLLPVQLALRLLAPAATADHDLLSIRLGDLPAGQYRVCSHGAATGPPACASGWLAPGATLHLEPDAPR